MSNPWSSSRTKKKLQLKNAIEKYGPFPFLLWTPKLKSKKSWKKGIVETIRICVSYK